MRLSNTFSKALILSVFVLLFALSILSITSNSYGFEYTDAYILKPDEYQYTASNEVTTNEGEVYYNAVCNDSAYFFLVNSAGLNEFENKAIPLDEISEKNLFSKSMTEDTVGISGSKEVEKGIYSLIIYNFHNDTDIVIRSLCVHSHNNASPKSFLSGYLTGLVTIGGCAGIGILIFILKKNQKEQHTPEKN
jgi:hypothetical protein